jgi:hypothetical protein
VLAAAGVWVAVFLGAAVAPAVPARMPVAVPTEARDVVAAVATTVVPMPADPRASWLGGGAVAPLAPDAPDAPDALTLPPSEPTHVRIPSIEVDSALVGLGLQDDGRMEVPPGAFPAGWYTGAPTPGELGPAILAGHVDHGGRAGVFSRLHDLQPGDAVEVSREDGTTVVFRVTQVEQHPKDTFPTVAVYGDIDHAGLRLITCGGPFDRRVRSYEDNIVVFAELDPGASDALGRRS